MSASYIGSFLIGQQLTALQVALDAEKAKTAALQTWASDRVKYAYPNGGSAGDERTIALDSIYTVPSPFGVGVNFNATSESFNVALNEWVPSKLTVYSSSVGGGFASASTERSSSGVVVIATGSQGYGTSHSDGAQFDYGNDYATRKWRIKCVKED